MLLLDAPPINTPFLFMLDFHFYKQLHSAQGTLAWQAQAQLPQGALLGVYGASGAGKTTLLRLLAGLDQAQRGHLKMGEEHWYKSQEKFIGRLSNAV